MAVQCPYCRHELSLKTAPPGMYTTACPDCGRKFYLAIPEDPEQTPVAAPLASEREQIGRLSTARKAPIEAATSSDAESKAAADGRLLTLPADPRSMATLPGPNATVEGVADTTPAPAEPSPRFSWARSRAGSVPRLLGGYLVLRELGRTSIGSTYLARQLWLGRVVNLNVMRLAWARNAAFVARFTRQAYAAAQLRHPNLAPILDFGESKGITYFCTEHVEGQNLAELTRQRQRLGPEEAAAYVLQAARGLRNAHDQSMIHRDIKPENLWLDCNGLVKVAGLGLVNSPELAEVNEAMSAGKASFTTGAKSGAASAPEQIAIAGAPVGTPTFMAPEMAGDPARVDARADIYSLGCTLYFLVTGRPPFEGRSAAEILNKQQTEAVIAPDQIVRGVPKSLSTIILKMLAKRPQDRHANLSEAINALESFLGIAGTGPLVPREGQADLLEQCVETFHASPAARLRSRLLPAILGTCIALAVLCLLTGRVIGAGIFASLAAWTALADFVLAGIRHKTPLSMKVRELISRGSLSEWLTTLAALAILIELLSILNLFWLWLSLALLATGIAVALHAGIDRHAESERREPRDRINAMLRSLRLQGHDEVALRHFVWIHSATHGEALFESLFGYDTMREARERWGDAERAGWRPKFAFGRDFVAGWLDRQIAARREAKERAYLEKIEERNLQSLGVNLVSARRKAKRSALAMVVTAAEIRESLRRSAGTIVVNHSIARSVREAAVNPERILLDHESGLLPDRSEQRSSRVARAAGMLIGRKVRFLAGAALLAGCVAWMHQNAMISTEHARALVDAAKSGDVEAISSHARAGIAHARAAAAQPRRPLALPGVPSGLLAIISSLGAGAGGLILIVSSLFRGTRISLFAIPAAAIPVMLPRLWHPALGGLDPSLVPSIVGAVILAAGIVFARR